MSTGYQINDQEKVYYLTLQLVEWLTIFTSSKQMLKFIESGRKSRDKWMLKIFKECAIKHKRNSNYQVWTYENHAIEIVSSSFFENKLDYIHKNPVRAGIVQNAEDYLYSSARNYNNEVGEVFVTLITRKWKTIV